MVKNLILGRFGSIVPKFGLLIFFLIWLRQSLDIMVSYHHVKISEETNDPIMRKFSHEKIDGQTDRQTDGRERFYRMLSDMKVSR